MTSLETLAGRLNVPADRLDGLGSYDDAQIATLDAIIDGAFTAEDRAFDKALEDTLNVVPRLVRPVARKLLFGGER